MLDLSNSNSDLASCGTSATSTLLELSVLPVRLVDQMMHFADLETVKCACLQGLLQQSAIIGNQGQGHQPAALQVASLNLFIATQQQQLRTDYKNSWSSHGPDCYLLSCSHLSIACCDSSLRPLAAPAWMLPLSNSK